MKKVGLFLLAVVGFPVIGSAADVEFYILSKGVAYEQYGSGPPSLRSSTPYEFNAFVAPTVPGYVDSASMTPPDGLPRTLVLESDGEFSYTQEFSSASAMNATYPAGSYHYQIATDHDGTKDLSLSFGESTFPNSPHVSNWSAAQAVDSAAAFTVHWDPFDGGTTDDLILFEIEDDHGTMVFEADTFALDGTATSVVIPAGTLEPGQTYWGWISFVRLVNVDETSYAGAFGAAVYQAATDFPMVTLAPGGWWSDATDLGGGWYWLEWFGYFADGGNGWIYHNEHQWMYGLGSSPGSIWFWTEDMGWLWTADTVYPYLYRSNDGAWLWYQVGSAGPRWFFNLTAASWEAH